MLYFDEKIDRVGTNCMKWDVADQAFEAEDVLPLWVADMDFKVPKAIIDAMIERATHGVFGYNVVPHSYYNSIINWMERRHNLAVDKEWIVYTPGVIPALYWSVGAFTKPGDKVLVQSPVYYMFYNAIAARNREVVVNELKLIENKYIIDYEDLESKLSDPLVKIMMFCSPHNPVGRVWTREELNKVAELCLKYKVLLVSDEIHADLVWKGHKHIPIASLGKQIANNSITCLAPSKTFNLAGLSTAYAIIPSEDIKKQFCQERRHSAIHSPDIFGAIALETAYNYGEEWLEELLEYLEANYNYLETFINENLPDIEVFKPEGTYLAWINFHKLDMSKEELKVFLNQKARVALDQGFWFGQGGEGFARINIACHRTTLEEALNRIKTAIESK